MLRRLLPVTSPAAGAWRWRSDQWASATGFISSDDLTAARKLSARIRLGVTTCRSITMRLLAGLWILAVLMSGCSIVRVTSDCPDLPPPPVAAIEALQSTDDPTVDNWAVALERHHQMLDVCLGP